MADLVINVKTISGQPFDFTPNQLTIRTLSTDIQSQQATTFFNLVDTNLDNSRYISREWVDKGNVIIPLSALTNCVDAEGNLIPAVVNQLLAPFNLVMDESI